MTRIVENRSGVLVSTQAAETSVGAGDAGRIPQLNSLGVIDATMIPAGTGTVTSVSGVTANGVSFSIANPTTTPAITITLGAITPSSVNSAGTIAGTNITAGGNTTGNSATATALATSRNFSISGGGITAATVGFNGTAAVVLSASVDAGHITLARMADVATSTVFYRKTAGTGAPEVQTLATLKTDLGLTGTNSGDQTITLTGDVTGSGTGSFASTLATVNSNVGSFGSATQVATFTVNAKGLTTAAANVTITPAASSITGGAALTKTNDTNVTLTLGGTPTTALLAATSLTLGWTGSLAVGRGGTGITSYAIGDIIYASGSTTLSKLADVATGNALISGGVTTAPSWGKIGLTTHVSGTLPVANGGTNVTSLGNITKTDDTNVTLTLGGTPTGAVITSTSFTLGWTGTLSVARGGTGDSGTAWTTYTPTVAAGSGSFTSVSATGAYKTIGKTVFVRIKVTITTNGTASSYWTVTAPSTSINAGSGWSQILFGMRTDGAPSVTCRGQLDNNSNLIYVQDYAGNYLGGNGYVINITGCYEQA